MQQVIDAMSLETVQAKQYVIKEGDYGTHLYVSEEGNYEITKTGMHIKKFSVGETFGELAILYNTKRFASIQGRYLKKYIFYLFIIYNQTLFKYNL